MSGIVGSCKAVWNGIRPENQKVMKACAGGACTFVATRALMLAKATEISNLSLVAGGLGTLITSYKDPSLGGKVTLAVGSMIVGTVDQIDPLAAVASIISAPLPLSRFLCLVSTVCLPMMLCGGGLATLAYKLSNSEAATLYGFIGGGFLGMYIWLTAIMAIGPEFFTLISPELVGAIYYALIAALKIYKEENPLVDIAAPGGPQREGYVPPVFGYGEPGEPGAENPRAEGVPLLLGEQG